MAWAGCAWWCCCSAPARASCAAAHDNADVAPLPDSQARALIDTWQQRLAEYIATAGSGDPAALARLPGQRASGTLRPARIISGVLDLDVRAAEADGFDVQGLLR